MKHLILLLKLIWTDCILISLLKSIKTHGRMSVAKKDVRHTSVLFTGTAKSLFLTNHNSITMYCTNFYQIYIFYALNIHDFTY